MPNPEAPVGKGRRALLGEFLKFFAGSAVGLSIDLVGFQLLHLLGVPPWLANVISAGTSITVVYFLVTRYAFGDRTRPTTYLLFVGWYSLSIVVFSVLIQVASTLSGVEPIVWKAVSVPFSFAANYLFSRFLFRSARADAAQPTE